MMVRLQAGKLTVFEDVVQGRASGTACVRFRRIANPIAPFFLSLNEREGSIASGWMLSEASVPVDNAEAIEDPTLLPDLADALREYFGGDSAVCFAAFLIPNGPPFFCACWEACRRIPPGQVRTYGELGVMAGATRQSARAVGQAMRHNPLAVIVPCHRVISASGALHGYAGSTNPKSRQVRIKTALIELERDRPKRASSAARRWPAGGQRSSRYRAANPPGRSTGLGV